MTQNEAAEKRCVCGISNLRVLISEQDGEWFAQGVEIDYGASGRSLEEAQQHFEKGLCATVDLHLRRFNSLDRLVKYAPEDIWTQAISHEFDFNMVTVHDISSLSADMRRLPFNHVAYLPQARLSHAVAAQG